MASAGAAMRPAAAAARPPPRRVPAATRMGRRRRRRRDAAAAGAVAAKPPPPTSRRCRRAASTVPLYATRQSLMALMARHMRRPPRPPAARGPPRQVHAARERVHVGALHAHIVDADLGVGHTAAVPALGVRLALRLPVAARGTCGRGRRRAAARGGGRVRRGARARPPLLPGRRHWRGIAVPPHLGPSGAVGVRARGRGQPLLPAPHARTPAAGRRGAAWSSAGPLPHRVRRRGRPRPPPTPPSPPRHSRRPMAASWCSRCDLPSPGNQERGRAGGGARPWPRRSGSAFRQPSPAS
jgi:hypothetical protein